MGQDDLKSEFFEAQEQLSKQLETSFELLTSIKSDWADISAQLLVGCYASCVELSQAIDFLCDNEKYFEAKIILRSLLEHFVELGCLLKNPQHFLEMQLGHTKKIRLKLKYAKENNRFLGLIATKLDITDEIVNWDNVARKIDPNEEIHQQIFRQSSDQLEWKKSTILSTETFLHWYIQPLRELSKGI